MWVHLGESHSTAKRLSSRPKKLKWRAGACRPEDFVNRTARFLCGFKAGGGKSIERPAKACLAWIGRGESGGKRVLLLQKSNHRAFCFGAGPSYGARTCIDWFNRK
jgi:hypothetical protein